MPTSQNTLRALEQPPRILHLATHAKASNGETSIILWNGEKIELSDIYQLQLQNTELVTLSACETSIGEWQVGEGRCKFCPRLHVCWFPKRCC